MAHPQQRDFCLMVRARFPQHFSNVWALDIGSLNINGSNRALFEDSGYIGIDLGVGDNVDFVIPGHKLQLPDDTFDTVISTECFEHDPYYAQTIQNGIRMLKPGGLFFFTCATVGRPEHGTRRTSPRDAPLQQTLEEWQDYYKNLTADDIQAVIDVNKIFAGHEFSTNTETQDLYFWGVKRGVLAKRRNYSFIGPAEQSRLQRAEIEQLKTKVEAGTPGALAMADRLAFVEKRMAELAVLARESATEVRLGHARADELEDVIAQLKNQINWYENTQSWKVTKPLRFASRMRREGVLAPLQSYFAKRLNKGGVTAAPVPPPVAPPAPAPERPAPASTALVFDNPHIRVMTTKHTAFVARLVSETLKAWGYSVTIDEGYVASPNTGYVVICPQMYDQLPAKYAAFQMEQSVNSRWFTPKYFEILKAAEVIFDYAIENIEFLSNAGIPTGQLFYLPITPRPAREPLSPPPAPKWDFVFYGDPNSPRRQRLLQALSRHFKVLVLSEVFGEELVERMREARAVINVHYYEEALLETTRLSEAISLGFPMLSEGVANKATEALFDSERVAFFRIGDEEDMVERARMLLTRLDRAPTEATASPAAPGFPEYLERYLVYRGHLPLSSMSRSFYPEDQRDQHYPRLCLSLPETPARQRAFVNAPQHGFRVFQGVRGGPGWVGCALSYKYMAREALNTSARYLTVCEDDVVFSDDFRMRFHSIEEWLRAHEQDWDVYSGLIADLRDDAVVTAVDRVGEFELITISRMTSTVFNVYSRRGLELLSNWDEHNRDAATNTIDRYLERVANLRVVVSLPYLVGHSEDLHSTIWGFQNSQYSAMIQKSEVLLRKKAEDFLRQAPQAVQLRGVGS